MKIRKLLKRSYKIEQSERQVPQLDKSVQLAVITKAPEKYILIDTETGQSYVGSSEPNKYIPEYCLWKPIDIEMKKD